MPSRCLKISGIPQGSHIENVVVPFTDGRKSLKVLTNLDKTVTTQGAELTNSLEKSITLAVIDDAWKEHLRAMDDLKQSVQTAYLEQKDPLVIYKMEAYNQFRNMNADVNRDIVSFLSHCYPARTGRKHTVERRPPGKNRYEPDEGQ